ncbi:MAG: exodeoxyribonuclease VII large subunit [Acidobacteria bacterium]|nr:exodeoxyribonuclease VII large subunit [Acidobacteriota bacterium]
MAEQMSLIPEAPKVFTVTDLTASIQRLLSHTFDDIRVSGEISGCKLSASGHAYFTLKDAGAQIRCALFRNSLRYLRFRPSDGLAVIARGSIDVYQPRGDYQLIVTSLEPQGYGALQLAFEQLKAQLAAEGLFAQERKRALPAFPRRIGIVTSPRGAVISDMLTVLRRRFPGLHIRLYPTLVQGEGAAAGVCEGIRVFSESGWPDVVIVGRGGGSLEDLWTFNEESVARAIAASAVPVVSAVGHETDFTIADFVADLRAPTPSAAAELIVPDRAGVLEQIGAFRHRTLRAMSFRISQAARQLQQRGADRAAALLQRRIGKSWQRVDELEQRLRARDPRARLARFRSRLQAVQHQAAILMRARLTSASLWLNPLAARLDALNPSAVLHRGYSIVSTEEGIIVRSPESAPPGTRLDVRLEQGRLKATVD